MTVLHLKCDNDIYGCLINGQFFSSIFLNKVDIKNTSTSNEGLIFLENSFGKFNEITIINSENLKFKDSCISSYSSNIYITGSLFNNYSINCIYSSTLSNISINDSSIFFFKC